MENINLLKIFLLTVTFVIALGCSSTHEILGSSLQVSPREAENGIKPEIFWRDYADPSEVRAKNRQYLLDLSVGVIDNWFFVASKQDYNKKGYLYKATKNVVKNDEMFGVAFKSDYISESIPVKIQLVVPGKPENFSCNSCKPGDLIIGADRRTITVNTRSDPFKEVFAFYWGIAEGDPRGIYQIRLFVGDKLLQSTEFLVE